MKLVWSALSSRRFAFFALSSKWLGDAAVVIIIDEVVER
jgi:hypothetical protein